jgi:predicted N-acetyltransferase YhbS
VSSRWPTISPSTSATSESAHAAMRLGPLAVLPSHQRSGVGAA